ncbi:MAG: LLM class flavin-dependent oxidoreductase [Ilumatobacter sp.]|uniref:LLM class flavin-dependent oxidoreductase n=1 Tax=Ilumatobacter sp. TaxID=1967498 RepID=UPI0026354F65|nr:LLM class flavin-dependent oxidoreductase [Ilumatobacter sp.]MDJ0767195.1 LLM class flavin-dependent oxidoreductase [Ilumatobacter sp.]
MRVDANFYGSVPMPDAGAGAPAPVDRRYGNADFLACYDHLTHWAGTMDRLGYDTMWLTEHHFQYEGYEVTPNLILFGLHLAKETQRLRLGQMFNIVPQWHPLRLAEDAAMMQILTGNRMQFGVGRGTVPREAQSLGGVVASGDNEMSAELDRQNRELFEESMEIIKAAWANETFSYTGKHFVLPPPGIPDRGSTVQDLTLIPKPIAPIDIWQAVTTPPTLEYCARVGHHAVLPARGPQVTKRWWDDFAERAAEHGWHLGPGEARCLAINAHVGRTSEGARRTARNPHDEWIKFLAPYGRFRGYAMPDGSPAPFDHRPPLEDSIDQQVMAIGSVEEVADTLGTYRDTLGCEHVVLFFDMPGLTQEQMDEQLELMAGEVLPRLGVTLDPTAAAPTVT